jgi:hypothetical protein
MKENGRRGRLTDTTKNNDYAANNLKCDLIFLGESSTDPHPLLQARLSQRYSVLVEQKLTKPSRNSSWSLPDIAATGIQ